VQVWNQLATELWGLRPDEVVGKSFAELDIGLPVDQLVGPIQKTLEASRNDRHETREIIVNAVNRRGRDLVCRVRLTPLTAAPGIGHGIGRGVCILMEQTESREDAEEAGR